MAHRCPITQCPIRNVPDERLLCGRHWAMVPVPLQRTIYRLWRGGNPAPGHAEACASAIEQVTAAMATVRRRA